MRLEQFFQKISNITLKLTMGCNLKCTYCNTETVTPQTPMLSAELYKTIASLLIENSQSRELSLEYHGGEPLLLSDPWFAETSRYAFALARKHHKNLDLPIVTNGTLLTEERLLALRDMGIRFCISCDGPPHINDSVRGSGHAVERAIRLLRKHHIPFGLLTVMSHANYRHMSEVMDWFASLGIDSFSLNFIQPQGRGIHSPLLDSNQMFEGMRQVLDHMYRNNCAVYEDDMARYVERFIEGREASPMPSCWEFECQAGQSYIAIDLYGRIHACGSDMANHVLGRIGEDMDEAHYRRKLAVLHAKTDWAIRCFDCAAARICNHSCATSDFNDMQEKENECGHTKLLWKHLCEFPHKPARVYEQIRRQRPPRWHTFVPLSEVALRPALASQP